MTDRRQNYAHASDFFIAVAERVRADQWETPGLGVWTVRELVGHTSRALSNVERDLATPGDRVGLEDAVSYFAKGLAIPGMAESVAQRGREAGVALGADPVSSVRALVDRVRAVLAQTPDDLIVASSFGGMRLPVYLPTKTFELIVHTLDIAAAIGVEPEPPADALAESIEITVGLALRSGWGPTVLHALAGRRGLPAGFSVI